MATIVAKGFIPHGGYVPLRVDTNPKANSFHENKAKENKKKNFPVVYCPNCEEVRDKRGGMRYGKDWPMKRQLVHSICNHCIKKYQEDLCEELCEYCPLPSESRGIKYMANCEGSRCADAVEHYLEIKEEETRHE